MRSRSGGVEVLEDGTVVEYHEEETEEVKLQRKEFAKFKFTLLETVAADPMRKSPHLVSLMVLAGQMANYQTREFYLSITSIMVKGNIGSRETAKTVRRDAVRLGYFVAVPGKTGPDGEQIYKLSNPRLLDVRDHVAAALEKRNEDAAREKREYRNKLKLKTLGGLENGPPDFERGANNCVDGGLITVPNTLDDTSDIILHEKEAYYPDNSYASVKDGDEDKIPYPQPENEQEADRMLAEICDGFAPPAIIRDVLRGFLKAGNLTPEKARGMLSPQPRERDAA